MRLPIPAELIPLTAAFADLGVPVYAVGGFVRNAILRLPPSDIDVCSRLTPDEALRDLPARGIRVVPKAASLGTVELHFADQRVEHTTFRSERYGLGGAHRPNAVAFGASLHEDAARRDFSLNALYLDLVSGETLDPTGGLIDLQRGVLRTTSADPDDILRADALRVLRLVRFAASFGFTIDEQTWRAARRHAKGLCDVAAERRREELSRLLLCETRYPSLGNDDMRSPLRALTLLDELDCWDALIPAFSHARGVMQRPDYHRYDVLQHSFHVCAETPPDEALRLAGLLHDIGKPACMAQSGTFHRHELLGEAMARETLLMLRYPRRTIDRVCALVRWHMFDIRDEARLDTLRLRFASLGRELTRDLIALREADVRGSGIRPDYVALRWRQTFDAMLRDNTPFSPDELAISGNDVMERLQLSGEAVGRVKDALWRRCVKRPCDNERARLLIILNEYR